jgi:hypothetical protein
MNGQTNHFICVNSKNILKYIVDSWNVFVNLGSLSFWT